MADIVTENEKDNIAFKIRNELIQEDLRTRDIVIGTLLERNNLSMYELKEDNDYLEKNGYELASEEKDGFTTYALYKVIDKLSFKVEIKSDVIYREDFPNED